MSGFAVWVASWQGTAAAMSGALVAGMLIGWSAGRRPRGLSRRERRELADRAADRAGARAAGQFRAMREPTVWQYLDLRTGKTLGEEWDRIHPGWREQTVTTGPPPSQAFTLVRDDLTDSAYTADMAARVGAIISSQQAQMEAFRAELCGVPYSADELWSGQ